MGLAHHTGSESEAVSALWLELGLGRLPLHLLLATSDISNRLSSILPGFVEAEKTGGWKAEGGTRAPWRSLEPA